MNVKMEDNVAALVSSKTLEGKKGDVSTKDLTKPVITPHIMV